jgi:hypothetical protein
MDAYDLSDNRKQLCVNEYSFKHKGSKTILYSFSADCQVISPVSDELLLEIIANFMLFQCSWHKVVVFF